MADSELLTVAEVADALRVVDQTVYNWIDRGELPAVRVGSRRVRVRRADFEAFVEAGGKHTNQHPTPPPPQPQSLKVDPEVIDTLKAFGEAAVKLADALENNQR